MAVTGIGTYASYTNSYGNTQNAGNKTGRTYKNAHEYKNYLTQKYDCLRSRDYSVNINSSLLSKAMGDEKTKQWLEYNLSLIPKTIEQSRAYVAARGAKILSYSITINGYDSMSSVMCTQDEVDPGTEKARKELEERLEKRKAEKKETEERLEKGYGIFKCGNEPFFYSISYYKKYKRYSADSDGYSSYAETSFVCTDYRNWWNY